MPSGEELARWAQAGAGIMPSGGRMCNDCAFKLGTVPNADAGCMEDIEGCFYRDRKFHCAHVEAEEGKEPVCNGFTYALKYLTEKYRKL